MMVADGCYPALFASSLLAIRLCCLLLTSFYLWRFIMHPSYPLFFGIASLIRTDTSLAPDSCQEVLKYVMPREMRE
jgi:hypothetical protein